jgi:serine protease Do
MTRAYPVAALQAPASLQLETAFRGDPATTERGSWVVHVTATEGGDHLFAPGHLEGAVLKLCGGIEVLAVETNLPLSRESLGGGVFDIDDNLLGLVIECDDGPTIVGPNGIDAILAASESFEGQILRRYGMRLRPLEPIDQEHFGAGTGLLVTEVRIGLPADRAGVEPGDVLQRLDDEPVVSIDDLARLVLPVALPDFGLSVLRDGDQERLTLPAVEADSHGLESGAPQGIALGDPEEGLLIERVAEGSPADRAKLEAGDRLLAVDGRAPRSADEARRLLAGDGRQPAFVVVRRGSSKLGTLIAE